MAHSDYKMVIISIAPRINLLIALLDGHAYIYTCIYM